MMQPVNQQRETSAASCNVNSRFNFTVGALAIVAAFVIGYSMWHWLW